MEDFSYVLTVVKKCIIVTKLCKERFAFLFFYLSDYLFFSIIFTTYLFLLLYFWRKINATAHLSLFLFGC